MEKTGQERKFFLDPYRVLDLTDEKGYLCGKILAGLGMDVIKVEPPGGDRGRNVGPFYGGAPHPEKSLYWLAFNLGKRGITLNLETQDGKEIFKKLAAKTDFVIESFDPGYLESLGFGYSSLSQINPRVILTSITPFGQTGPRSGFKGSDIVCWAGSGYMWLTGDSDRAPLRISFPQAYLHGGGEGAMASMMALWASRMTGEGQHVDVSIQECIMLENLNQWGNWEFSRRIIKREGAYRAFGPYRIRYVYPCKDGFVVFMLLGGHVGARGQRALVEWMDREGMANDLLRGFDWNRFDSAAYTDEMARVLEPAFGKFLLTKTKEELFAAARKMQVLLAPMNTIKEVLESPHFRERNLWVEVEHPEWGTRLPYPGAPFKSSEVSWNTGRRPPLIGENNREIYEGELGYSKEQLSILKCQGVI